MPICLVGDNDGCFMHVSNDNPKMSTEPTLTLHLRALRELLGKQCVREFVWCDNRDMIAYLTKGKTRRNVFNAVLHNGEWIVAHETKKWNVKSVSSAALFVQGLVRSTTPSLSLSKGQQKPCFRPPSLTSATMPVAHIPMTREASKRLQEEAYSRTGLLPFLPAHVTMVLGTNGPC